MILAGRITIPIAALFLATGAAHAGAGEIWRFNSYKTLHLPLFSNHEFRL